jgi:hypothetical protein
LLEEITELKKKLERSNEVINNEKVYVLQTENDCLKLENLKLIKRYKALSKKTRENIDDDIVFDYDTDDDELHVVTSREIKNYGNIITSLRKNIKNKAGTYTIDGKDYDKLEGTRQEVWDEIAYQTSGTLKKTELLINKSGVIVSKRKSMAETHLNRLLHCGINKPSKVESEVDRTLPLEPLK